MIRARLTSAIFASGLAVAVCCAPSLATAAPIAVDPFYEVTTTGAASDLAVQDPFGNVYVMVVTPAGAEIRKIDSDGVLIDTFALPAGAQPSDMAVDALGDVYVSDSGTGAISRITPDGVINNAFSASPDGKARALSIIADDATLYVLGASTSIYEIGFSGVVNPAFTFSTPTTTNAIDVDRNRNVYAASMDGRVIMLAPDGKKTTWMLDASPNVTDIEARNDGSWVVYADLRHKIIERTVADDINTTTLPSAIDDIAMDSAGSIYFVDQAGALMTLPHGGYAPQQVGAFTTTGTPSAVRVGATQTLVAAWGANPTVATMPFDPSVSSAPITATIGEGETFTSTITTAGGLGSASVKSANLPTWLTLTNGVLSGTATAPGTYVFDVVASNDLGDSSAQTQTIVVTPAVVPSPTPSPTSGDTTGAGGNGGSTTAGGSSGAAAGGRGALASTGNDGAVALASTLVSGGIALIGVAAMVFARRRRPGRTNG